MDEDQTTMAPLASNEACRKCGSPLGRFAPGRVCARCLLEAGLSDSAFEGDADHGREPGPPQAPNLGRFGRYELLEEIAHGGMGVVYRARDMALNRIVALKLILAGQFASEREVKRFRAEAEASARLDHPNIVPIYEVGEQEGRPFFSMKFMEGGTLTARLTASTAPLDSHEAAGLLVKIARAVHHAHQRAILHRDLKPGNILRDARCEPYVSDFGLAKYLDSAEGLTLSGAMLGSPNYMSPEQAAGQSERLTTASDTYSLGALLYHLLTGRPPFEAATPLATMKRVIEEEPRKPGVFNSAVDRDLETICLKCLEKDPQRRYASADAMAEELERWLSGEPIQARPSTATERLTKWMRRNPKVAALVMMLILVFGVGVGGVATVSLRLASTNRAKEVINTQLVRNIRDFEWQKVDELIATGKRPDAVALLASFLRKNSNDWTAATRLVSMMSGCNFVVPAGRSLRHGTPVNCVGLSGDGRRALTGADDGTTRLWDLSNGTLLQTLPHPLRVTQCWFATDERFVFTTSVDGSSRLWDVAQAKVLWDVPKGQIAVALSRDRSRLALLESETSLQVWDLAPLQRAGALLRLPAPFRSARFVQDAEELAVVCTDGTVRVWKIGISELEFTRVKVPGTITWVEWSPDGKVIASADGDQIAFWRRMDGSLLKHIHAHDGQLLKIEFTPDGGRLVSVAYDRPPKIWDVRSGQMLGQPLEAEGPRADFRVSPDGKKVATFSQTGVARLWDASSGLAVTELFEHEGPIVDLAFTPDGRFILTASQDGTAQLWDARAGLPGDFILPTTDIYPSACFSRDGQRVYRTSQLQVEMFDIHRREGLGHPMPHSDQIFRMQLSPDGTKLATAGFDGVARIWNARTGEPVSPPLNHNGRVKTIAFSPDGRLVATGSADQSARPWDGETGQSIGPALVHPGDVNYVHFRPDSQALLAASADGTVRVWSVATGQALWPEPLKHKGIVWTAEFSPDGRRVVTASEDKSAILWDVETRRPLAPPLLHERGVSGAHFSPDGCTVLTFSRDGTARVWEAVSGLPTSQPMRHKDRLKAAVFSPDGRRVLTGSRDGVVRLWDARTGYPISEPFRHASEITGLQFSADRRRCLSIANLDSLRVCDTLVAPTPVPPWFCEFVEVVAGKRLDARGDARQVPRQSLQSFRDQFQDAGGTDFYSRWAHWFLHERLQETVPAFEPSVVGQTAPL